MLTVACVQVGNYCGHGVEYVNRLRAGVARHLRAPHRFVCISDQGGYDARVEVLPAEEGLAGWWQKLALFKPGKLPGERAVFFDLDTVILGTLRPLADWRGDFGMLSDLMHPERPASGVMAWCIDSDFAQVVWDGYRALGRQPQHKFGDGGWIGDELERAGIPPARLQASVPGIDSFKVCQRKYGHLLPSTRILCFHGQPRPHDTHVWDAQQ